MKVSLVSLLLLFSSATAAATPSGRVVEQQIPSARYGKARKVWVYTPPGYDARRATPYDLLVFFDGADYREEMPLPAVLDNLQAEGKLRPAVAVLVDTSEQRLEDLANHQRFADFIGEELMPWVASHWRVTSDPARRLVGGYSAGGLGAAYVAYRRPELFGNVLSQSGAFWRGNEGGTDEWEWLTRQYRSGAKAATRFYVEVGALETAKVLGGSGPVFLEANRRFRDALQAKGYPVTYVEVPGARHEPAHWRQQLAPGLVALLGESR